MHSPWTQQRCGEGQGKLGPGWRGAKWGIFLIASTIKKVNPSKLYNFKGWTLWCINCVSIKLLLTEIKNKIKVTIDIQVVTTT